MGTLLFNMKNFLNSTLFNDFSLKLQVIPDFLKFSKIHGFFILDCQNL